MKTIVNEKAIQTREYKNYLFSELLKCAPLQKDQSVRIKVVESETPFQKITQGLDNFSDRGFVSGETLGTGQLHPRSFIKNMYSFDSTRRTKE